MGENNKTKLKISRRKFLGTSAAAAAVLSAGPLSSRCTPAPTPSATGIGVPNSKFGGVQIGATTYGFRDGSGMEYILQACIEAGLSSIELRQGPAIEAWCGAPEQIRVPRQRPTAAPTGAPGGAPSGFMGGGQQEEMSEEEYAALQEQAAAAQEALHQWRLSPPIEKFKELAQMFRDAGVDIHIVKWTPGSWPEDEIDYAFKVTQAMGVNAITDEMSIEAAQSMGPIAEKYGMKAVMHSHYQYADPEFDMNPILDVSPAVMLNLDIGHYFGSTGLNPADFIREHHERIFSIHLKDKTGLNTDPSNANQVWGQGETPLEDSLLLIKENKWPIYCDIELEYRIAPWSNTHKETRTCVNYARQILI